MTKEILKNNVLTKTNLKKLIRLDVCYVTREFYRQETFRKKRDENTKATPGKGIEKTWRRGREGFFHSMSRAILIHTPGIPAREKTWIDQGEGKVKTVFHLLSFYQPKDLPHRSTRFPGFLDRK